MKRLPLLPLAALLCLVAVAGSAGGQESTKGLSKDQILKLLKGGDPLARVRYLVDKYGIAFPLTPEAEQELKQAGANQELLDLVRKLAPPIPAPPSPPPAPPPVLIVNAKPGEVEVYVDDERHGLTSPHGILKINGLKAGSHTLRLSLTGYRSYEATIELSPGETNTVVANLEPVPAPQPKEAPVTATPSPAKAETSAPAPALVPPKPPPDPNNPLAPHEPGVYYDELKESKHHVVRLEPAPSSSPMMKVSTKGSLLGGMSVMGRGGRGAWSSVILGSTAQVRLTELHPKFYFYFRAANENGSSASNNVFQTASSPTEFILVHLTIKKNEREIPTMGGAFAGGSASVRPKEAVPFGYEQVAPGIYKVQPREDMKPGEYGFLYGGNFAGVVPAGGGWLFDFGIDKEK